MSGKAFRHILSSNHGFKTSGGFRCKPLKNANSQTLLPKWGKIISFCQSRGVLLHPRHSGLIHLSSLFFLLEACNETCSACTNGFECSSCQTSLLMQNGQCVTSCGKGYFQNQLLCRGNSKQKRLQYFVIAKQQPKAVPELLDILSVEGSAVDIGVNVHPRVKEGVDRGTKSYSVKLITAWGNIH